MATVCTCRRSAPTELTPSYYEGALVVVVVVADAKNKYAYHDAPPRRHIRQPWRQKESARWIRE